MNRFIVDRIDNNTLLVYVGQFSEDVPEEDTFVFSKLEEFILNKEFDEQLDYDNFNVVAEMNIESDAGAHFAKYLRG